MKPKTILLVVFSMCTTFVAKSQTSDAEAEAIINLLGVQKREAISKLVPVSGKDSVAFWNIYTAYEKENKKTAISRLELYERTALAYSNMTPAVADSLAIKYFNNRFTQEKMLEDYYKKIKTSTNAIIAFEFYQAEVYMLTQLRASIMQQIPTYGQLKAATKK
jgi:superfamily I DNA and/or RNA helicase